MGTYFNSNSGVYERGETSERGSPLSAARGVVRGAIYSAGIWAIIASYGVPYLYNAFFGPDRPSAVVDQKAVSTTHIRL